jgi:hypothetical protein
MRGRERGLGLVVIKQQVDTTAPQGRLVFRIFGALDAFQRELIVEGTHEGLAAARAQSPGAIAPALSARRGTVHDGSRTCVAPQDRHLARRGRSRRVPQGTRMTRSRP